MIVYEGQINELIARNSKEPESLPCKTSNLSDISAISKMSTKSSYSKFAPEMQAAISSITGIYFKDDIDMPPIFWNYVMRTKCKNSSIPILDVKMMKNLKILQKN